MGDRQSQLTEQAHKQAEVGRSGAPSSNDGKLAGEGSGDRRGRGNEGQNQAQGTPTARPRGPAGRLEPSSPVGTAGGPPSREGMVDLMRREITAKEAVLLGPLLWAATGVNCLKLCYNHLKDGGAEAVSLAMRRHPSLHTMDLGESIITTGTWSP